MSTNINSTEQIVEINAGDQITNINLVSQSTTQVVSGEQVVTVDVNAGTIPAAWGTITGILSNQTDLQNALNAKQNNITLTTTGTTGNATLVGATLNIPNYVTSTKQTEWDSAYNDKITSAEVSGTSTKTLTLNQQDGGTITASWSDIDTAPVQSVFGRTGDVVATEGDYNLGQLGDVTITSPSSNQVLKYNGSAWVNGTDTDTGLTSVGLTVPTGLEVSGSPLTSNGNIDILFSSGYSIPTNAKQSQWDSAYNDKINSASVTGTTTKTLILNQQDGGSVSASWSDIDTGLTSVGLEMPEAFTVSGSPLTSNGTITVTANGTGAQYIKGDGTLATFPTTIDQSLRLIREVYNSTGSTLTKGTIVYINGGQGNLPTVTKAIATGDPTSAQTFGVVQSNITNNNNGYVVIAGGIDNLDTQAYSVGAALYLSPITAGQWTTTKPYAPDHMVYIGTVVRSHPTQGVVEVRIANGFELEELHNVSARFPVNKDGLFYNSTSGVWENKSIAGVLGYTPVPESRIITINGTAQDLSEDRTWSVGTVTNVAASGGTGISIGGSPVTGSGTITITNTAPDQVVSLTGAGTTTTSGTYPNFTITSNDQYTGTVTSVAASGGTGISISGSPVTGSGTISITNTAPDKIVTITQSGLATVSGTYPNFTVGVNDAYAGSVTSVNASVPTGFEVSGVPITAAGTIDIKFTSGYSLPTNAKQTQWDDAYSKRINSLTVTGNSGSSTLTSNVLNVPTYTLSGLGGEPAITAGTSLQYWRGDKTFQTLNTGVVPESGNVYFTEPRVRATVLSGLNITGGSISSSDNVLDAFGKVQNQINGLIGGSIFQSTWNASTNNPALASGVGTKGYYYIVSTAGTTNLDGITDWQIGDWAIFDGTVWRKVDNTDAVVSVNGFTGAVSLGISNLADVSAASPTDTQLLRFNGTTSKWYNWTPTFEPALTKGNLTEATSSVLTITGGSNAVIGSGTTIQVKQSSATGSGFLSSTDWNTFNNKQATITLTTTGSSGASTFTSNTLNVPNYTLSGLGGVPTSRTLTINGTAYDLSADRTWSVGTVTSVAALTIGTTGTDVSSTVANGTTTPVITLNIPDASASARGLITTGTQTIGGNKTFAKSILVGGGSDGEYALTLGEGRSGNGYSYVDLVCDATYTDYGLRLIRSNGGANTDSSIIHRGTGSLIIETTDGGAIKFRNSSGTDAATISSGNLTLNNGGDLVITAATSGSNTTLNNDLGTLLISTPSQITGNLTLASGGDLVITAASSGTNTTLYNDIGKLICTTSLSVSGTGEFSGAVSGTSATFTSELISNNQNALTRLQISNTTVGTGAYIETSFQSDVIAGAGAVGKFGSSTTAYKIATASNTYLYNNTAGDIAILNDFASGAIKFAAGGSSSAHLTIASTGAATFSSSVTATQLIASNTAPQLDLTYNGNTAYKHSMVGTGYSSTIALNQLDFKVATGANTQITALSLFGSGAATFSSSVDATSYIMSGWKIADWTGSILKFGGINASNWTQLDFYTNNSVKLSIASTGAATFSGNSTTVDINTLSRAINVTGKANYYPVQIAGSSTSGQSYGLTINAGTNSSDIAFQVYNQAESAIRFLVRGDGNVGINTASPSFKLHVVGGNFNQLLLDNAGEQYTALDFRNNGTTKTDFYYDNTNTQFTIRTRVAGSLIFGTNDTERMRITSGGELLINTTTDAGDYKLQVNGNIYTAGGGDLVLSAASSGGVATLYNDNGYFQTDKRLNVKESVTDYVGIFDNPSATGYGIQAIVNNDGTSYKYFSGYSSSATAERIIIYSNGNIVNKNGSYGTISDITLKENIVDATPKLSDLLKLKVRNFNLIGDTDKQIGFIAQELEEIFPKLIDTNLEGIKSIKSSVLIPIIVKAIQELNYKIDNKS